MKIIKRTTDIVEKYPIENFGKKEEILFFDIETTGFSAANTSVYLIGCVYYENDTWNTIQWLSESNSDEPSLIAFFFDFLKKFKTIIHFNGQGFDIPYLETKCREYMLPYFFDDYKSIDIYKEIYGFKDVLKVENLKQKTIEGFLGIDRDDEYNGGELINIYYEYLRIKSEKLESLLLLHNYEDIVGMLNIIEILSYTDIFKGKFRMDNMKIYDNPKEDVLYKKIMEYDFTLDTSVPKRINIGVGPFYVSAFNDHLNIKVKIYTDELKYFYPNYKDYYYLPVEDRSIHKSVAFYVDKKFRVKAKAANCYSKKTGQFLPQYEEVILPYFKIDYSDKITYFEVTDEFKNDEVLMKNYILHILNVLKSKQKM